MKNGLALKQLAVWICIYLFIWGNNARLILKVIDHREKHAATGSRDRMLIRAKIPLLPVSSGGDGVSIFVLYSWFLLGITFLCFHKLPQFVSPEPYEVQRVILNPYFSHHVLNLSVHTMSDP